jgi:hypothetical protein
MGQVKRKKKKEYMKYSNIYHKEYLPINSFVGSAALFYSFLVPLIIYHLLEHLNKFNMLHTQPLNFGVKLKKKKIKPYFCSHRFPFLMISWLQHCRIGKRLAFEEMTTLQY